MSDIIELLTKFNNEKNINKRKEYFNLLISELKILKKSIDEKKQNNINSEKSIQGIK